MARDISLGDRVRFELCGKDLAEDHYLGGVVIGIDSNGIKVSELKMYKDSNVVGDLCNDSCFRYENIKNLEIIE